MLNQLNMGGLNKVEVAMNATTGEIVCCGDTHCNECLFQGSEDANCSQKAFKWADEEYIEPEIDWSKVPVDTPVLVSHNKKLWYNRYFAGINFNGDPVVYSDGRTSWSNETFGREFEHFNYIELAEVE